MSHNVAENEQISVRYLLQKQPGGGRTGIDVVNDKLVGRIGPDTKRIDLARSGRRRSSIT